MAFLDRFKKIDILVIRSFIGPYLLSFFVAQFVLVMQFLWKYIDDILGKGFSVLDLMELIFYFAVTQIPMALPIAILLSSVMVFGNLSERYELSSMKSAGVSLIRIMRPAIYLALFTAVISLFASNYFKPTANFQFKKRLKIMKSQKPSLTIEAKIFNRDFGGYSIRVNEKDEDDEGIKDVFIYDHTSSDKSLVNFSKAEKGKMYNSEDGNLFIMELENGTSYREMKRERKKEGKGKKYPFMRTDFKEWKKVFDMSQFDTEDDGGINTARSKEDMMNTFQLLTAIDSVDRERNSLIEGVVKDDEREKARREEADRRSQEKQREKEKDKSRKGEVAKKVTSLKKTTKSKFQKGRISELVKSNEIMPSSTISKARNKAVLQKQVDTLTAYKYWYETISEDDKNNLPVKAIQGSGRRKDRLRNATTRISILKTKKRKYLLRLNQQYSFAMICLIFLFIGAPLGSIIRKGGYGYPLLFAILFYMLFIITTIMGEKLALKSKVMDPVLAAWFANLLVLPVAIWLTIKALRDSKFEQNRVFTWISNRIASLSNKSTN